MGYGFDEELAKKTREELEARRKAEKSFGSSVFTIPVFVGIAFVIVVVLAGLSEFGSPPNPIQIDTLPPDRTP